MRNGFVFLFSTLLASAMIVGGLWSWRAADDWVLDWEVARPDLTAWGIRAGAVAAILLAQMILLLVACRRIYQHSTIKSY